MKVFKIVLLTSILTMLFTSSSSLSESKANSYNIAGIYEKQELKSGAKIIDSYNNVKEAKYVLIPTKIVTRKYSVEITRIDSNFYQICGTSIVIETKYCYEYATRDDAVLNITSSYGYTRGEVIFL